MLAFAERRAEKRMFDTEESAARQAFGQHATHKYDTEDNATRLAFGQSQAKKTEPLSEFAPGKHGLHLRGPSSETLRCAKSRGDTKDTRARC